MTYTKLAQHNIVQRSAVALGVLLVLFLTFGFAQTAGAHEEPVGCDQNGVGLSLGVFRSDGTTSISGGASVEPGELIKYQVSLQALNLPNCSFGDGGGMLEITLPDGTVVDVTPSPDGIPLVSIGNPFHSEMVNYVVDSADVGGDDDLDARADYTNGISHTSDIHDSAGGFVTRQTQFEKLDPDPVTEVHDDDHSDVTDTVVTAGTEIHDMVAVGGGNGLTPTGNVDFELYDNLTCDGQLLGTEAGVGLDGSGEAESTPFTPDPGEYSYLVHYNGDDNFNEGTAECEPFTIVASLVVEKTVNESFDREWTWDITKTADQNSLELDEGESETVSYTVEVSPLSEDINHEVTGTITVTNPSGNPDAEVTAVDDVLDVSGAANVSCEDEDTDTSAPWTLSGGEVLTCTYEQLSASPDDSENEVTVTTSGDVPGGSDTQPVSFDEGDLDEVTDECVDVTDTNAGGLLGTVCADDVDMTFEYDLTFGTDSENDVVLECGSNEHENVAEFTTNDTSTTGDDNAVVTAEVTCGFAGCTPGYWRNQTENWEGYDPEGLFSDAFGREITIQWSEKGKPGDTPDPELGMAVEANGGGINALARHAVAALLNAAHPDVDYAMSESAIIDAVQDAIDSGDYEDLKNELAGFNEEGCTIDAHGNPTEAE